MSRSLVRRVTIAAALVALLAMPASVAATVTGGCTAEGHSTSSSVDITTETVWHLQSGDVAGGSGQAPTPAKSASVGAYALGISIPIASGTSKDEDGDTSGSVDGVSVSLFGLLGHVFVVGGSADNGCAGSITIIIDDVEPLFTILGGGGAALAVLGLLVVLALLRSSKPGIGKRLVDGIFGALGGIGAALALEQFEVLDPTEPFGLFIAIGAAVLGFITCGMFGSAPEPPAARAEWGGGSRVGGSAAAPGDSDTQRLGAEPELLPPDGRGGGGPM